MKILVLSRYSSMGASTRLRTAQYASTPEFKQFDIEFSSLFDDAYLKNIYSGSRNNASAARHLLNRTRKLISNIDADAIWLEYEALPWLPWLIEKAILPRGVPVISDFDDAIFHRYDQHNNMLVRWVLGQKIAHVMAASDVVLAGNPYLANYAQKAGAKNIKFVPTVLDTCRYNDKAASVGGSSIAGGIGWIGTPQTWSDLAKPIYDTLLPVLNEFGMRFSAIGAELKPRSEGMLDLVPWSEKSEAAMIAALEIGVMPLPDTPWTRGKCGYKLVQYMASAIPAIASPVGVNTDLIDNGINGFLAETKEDWLAAARKLLANPTMREDFGAAGRLKVEDHYSLRVWAPRLANIIVDTIKRAQTK